MTVASLSIAADEVEALFTAAWVTGAGYAAEYPNVNFDRPPLGSPWARFGIVYATGGQRTLASSPLGARYGKEGFVIVETFTPLGGGVKAAYDAAEIVLKAYQGKRTPSDIWFRNVRITDEGAGNGGDKAWWSITVIADFTFEHFN